MQKIALDMGGEMCYIRSRFFNLEVVVKNTIYTTLLLMFLFSQGLGQENWVMLQEYPSPGFGARELYYDGKLLWNVDNESNTVFTMDPYNLQVYDIYPVSLDQPWGLTHDSHVFWMTNFGNTQSQLVRMMPETLMVTQIFTFSGYYFYGLTYDSFGGHLWISAMNHGYQKFLMEFDPDSNEVVAWHSWPWIWNLGLQYWDGDIWVNSSDWGFPDYTYIINLNSWTIEEMLICPLSVPEGIATNGQIWWISHFRDGAPYIWKLVPPGTIVHDISHYIPIFPDSGILDSLTFEPQGRFINYGSVTENQVPFICTIRKDSGNVLVYYDSVVHQYPIEPETLVDITFRDTTLIPNQNYTIYFYSNLPDDDYRHNDSMHVHVHTVGPVHDLAITAIYEPDSLEPPGVIYPSIRIQNVGTYVEPVAPVLLKISRNETVLVEQTTQAYNLSPGESALLGFNAFTPGDTGIFTFTFDGQLPNDIEPPNDFRVVNTRVGMVHDVAFVQIVNPLPVMPFAPLQPKAYVKNLGDYFEGAFMACCTILDSTGDTSYYHQYVCPELNPGQQALITFPMFNPSVQAEYTFKFITELVIDDITENDTLAIVSRLGMIRDVAPTVILQPEITLPNEPFQPSVIVSNLGTLPSQAFNTRCWVQQGLEILYDQELPTPVLQPGQDDTIDFPNMAIPDTGNYSFVFVTQWLMDDFPENDTIEVMTQQVLAIPNFGINPITDFRVVGNYPNPFNAQTSFTVYLPASSSLKLDLYTLEGRMVKSMDMGILNAGVHQSVLDGADLSSGIYIARFRAGAWHQALKIVLLK